MEPALQAVQIVLDPSNKTSGLSLLCLLLDGSRLVGDLSEHTIDFQISQGVDAVAISDAILRTADGFSAPIPLAIREYAARLRSTHITEQKAAA